MSINRIRFCFDGPAARFSRNYAGFAVFVVRKEWASKWAHWHFFPALNLGLAPRTFASGKTYCAGIRESVDQKILTSRNMPARLLAQEQLTPEFHLRSGPATRPQ